MAMVINNNSSAQMALGELRKNNSKLDKASRQAASGVKINSASDGASEYSISEKMRVQIRGLEQDIANAQTGTSLIKTAEGGIQEIINNLRSLKELALNAANDHNSDLDRETIQKEVDSRLATIDDIAATTNYNGRLLLNGNYGELPEAAASSSVTEPTAPVTVLSAGDYTISSDGVYVLDAGFTGHLNVTATNVKFQQTDTQVNNTYIACNTPGTHLWLDSINIRNSSETTSAIRFTGANNEIHVIGNNNIEKHDTQDKATINIGGGLKISSDGTGSLTVLNSWGHGGAAIGTDQSEQSTGNINIENVDLDVKCYYGAAIGSGTAGASVGDITITGGNIKAWGTGNGQAATIGIGMYGHAGDITIHADSLDVTLFDGAGYVNNDGGAIKSDRGSVLIEGGDIRIHSDRTPAIASAANNNSHTYVNGQEYTSTDHDYVVNLPSMASEYLGNSDTELSEKIPLIIHTGTKANQHLRVCINSMDTGTLGIDPLPVNPLEAAVASLGLIDSAIDYSLNENTRMGAYQTELSYTIANLTTASENTQASESTIHDADMAKNMMEHAKYNILSQSAQSMLAQANQNSSSVLSLLQ